MAKPLMPKATAVWLIENTALTFEQIAEFCELHELEVQSIADEEVAIGIVGFDPIGNGQLTRDVRLCAAPVWGRPPCCGGSRCVSTPTGPPRKTGARTSASLAAKGGELTNVPCRTSRGTQGCR